MFPRSPRRRSTTAPRLLVVVAAAALMAPAAASPPATVAAAQPPPSPAPSAAAAEPSYATAQLRSEVESMLGAARAAERRRVAAYFAHLEAEAERAEAERVAAEQRAEAERAAAEERADAERRRAEAEAERVAAEQRAVAEQAAAARAAAERTPPSGAASGAGWSALRRCESGGDYSAVSASGTYRGAYQFSRSTWDSVASSAHPHLVGVDPAAAAPADQDAMAQALFDMSGSRPWPHCGRHLR